MKKKKWLALVLSLAMLVTGLAFMNGNAEADTAGDQFVSYATVKHVADFRSYIDNNYAWSSQDTIETDWSGYTDVYKVEIPSDGKLLVASLADGGYVNCELFTNFSLTSSLGNVHGIASSRDEIGSVDVQAGTYYYRGSRWNGAGPVTVSIYLGFIPNSPEGVDYTDISVQYDRTNNITMQAVTSAEQFTKLTNEDKAAVAQDTIETEWSGYSDVHSFTVEENGWLLLYPLEKDQYAYCQLYSNTAMTSMIFEGKAVNSTTEEPYACYLTPGTYYLRGRRWNGCDPMTITINAAFYKDMGRFAVASNVLSADKKSATVTFEGENGLIRVKKGTMDVSYIQSDEYWETGDRKNALEGITATITSNGDYVARLETEDGFYVMVPFTVAGIEEEQPASPTPIVPTQPTQKPSPAASPTPTPPSTVQKTPAPGGSQTTYKVKAAKKKITVKVKKKVKIQYSVTKGYTGKVTFTSSNKKIATVNAKGVVKGKKKGNCKITLKLSNGSRAVVNVKVKK